MKKLHSTLVSIFLFLMFCALVVLLSHAAIGHMGENPFIPNACPLCSAIGSFALGQLFLASLLVNALLQVIGIIPSDSWLPARSLFHFSISLRAPPFPATLFFSR